jgi:homoserine dehydrogenase
LYIRLSYGRQKISIGLFVFGYVEQALYDVLNQLQGAKASIERIYVKDRTKPRKLGASRFTFDKQDILKQKDIDVIV